jgi:V/A-type H+-transporting ATPase subunit I
MIVKMKKVSIVIVDRFRDEALRALRKLGLVHVEPRPASSQDLSLFGEHKAQLERASALLPEDKEPEDKAGKGRRKERSSHAAGAYRQASEADLERCLEVAEEVTELAEKIRLSGEETDRLERERERLSVWGDFDPDELRALADKGVYIGLYELGLSQYRQLPEDLQVAVIFQSKNLVRIAVVSLLKPPELEIEPLPLPELGATKLQRLIEEHRRELADLEQRLRYLAAERQRIGAVLKILDKKIEFERVRAGMIGEDPLAYLSGYIPAGKEDALKLAASENGWALLIDDPGEEDPAPTLIENPKWIRVIRPIFSLMETTPGYREFDISFLFLLFFSLFFAMLIGDAGYGIVLFGLTLFARLKMRKSPAEPFALLFVLSGATIVWGALSGTWFGAAALAAQPPFSRIVLPEIASFGYENTKTLMLICFVIGAVHLSIAHLLNFFRKLPRLAAYSELGSLTILWGMFFVIRYIVLEEALSPAAVWLIAAGLVLLVIFGQQRGRFFKDLLIGVAKLPLTLLNSIGSFSDIISYVRLFAVGLATVAVAANFNSMAAEVGFGFPSGLMSAFILFFGHTLNIVMGAMAVIVHGVRLNMLEFSGHMGMEWSGTPYSPFRETKAETPEGERRKE